MKVTQKEIAKKLNISQSHVARALQDDPIVAEKTRRRIQAVAREMGYDADANRGARALVMQRYGQTLKTGVIALVFSPEPGVSIRHIPFHVPVLEGMEHEAAKLNLDICFCATRPDEIPRLIRDRSVDGVIAIGYYLRYVQAIIDLDLPILTVYNKWDIAHSVGVDDRQGGYMATRHLLEQGHRRIAFLGIKHAPGQPCEARLQGYRDAMQEYGIDVPGEWIYTDLYGPVASPETGCLNCGECAACIGWDTLTANSGDGNSDPDSLPFSAVLCYNDMMAMEVAQRVRSRGFSVPQDLSVIGFDNISAQYHFQPKITSVDFQRSLMGEEAIRILHSAIESKEEQGDENTYQHRVLPMKLVTGESTQRFEGQADGTPAARRREVSNSY